MKKLISFCLGSLFFAVVGFALTAEFQSTLTTALVGLAGIGMLWGIASLFPAPLASAQCQAGYVRIYQNRSL